MQTHYPENRTMNSELPPAENTPPAEVPHSPAPVLRSSDLLQGRKEVVLEHEGEQYRLRLTRNGRLVLYK